MGIFIFLVGHNLLRRLFIATPRVGDFGKGRHSRILRGNLKINLNIPAEPHTNLIAGTSDHCPNTHYQIPDTLYYFTYLSHKKYVLQDLHENR